MPKIAVVGARHTTYETIKFLLGEGYELDLLVTLDPSLSHKVADAGYVDLREEIGSEFNSVYLTQDYSLLEQADIGTLGRHSPDLLIVIGWQRLIPDWLLQQLSIGAFGCHGSDELLPKGRGRSVINWCIIQGKEKFIAHLFRYEAGVDNGDIVDTLEFKLLPWDDIYTAHHKYIAAFCRMLKDNLPAILDGTAHYYPQVGEPTYFPKRTPAMGEINWSDSTACIHNLIRGITKPYPGAFFHATFGHMPIAQHETRKIMVWEAIPWDLSYDAEPGTQVESFHNGWFVMKTGDGALLIKEWE